MISASSTTMRRFTEHTPAFVKIDRLEPDHHAAVNGTTRYPATTRAPGLVGRVLKSGHNNRKIGAMVLKGRWAGMPIFTLTLEERATCPRSCRHWLDCFGNKMPFVERLHHGAPLEWALGSELRALSRLHPLGFVVRTHVLGDFYSTGYVRRWLSWLRRIPALRVFGYTAWPASSEIGALLRSASDRYWDRFAIRTSNGPHAERATRTLYQHPDGPTAGDAIVCPAQTSATDCCATCALCWSTRRNIAFLAH